MGRPPQRVRFNAKARQSTPGGNSHKRKRAKRTHDVTTDDVPQDQVMTETIDPNAEIIIPKSVEQKELDRKEKLRQELIESSNSKMTSKKRKRMEAYIEKKLKKEERVQIFERLALSQATITSLNLQSSSTLGSGKPITHAQRIAKDEHQFVKNVLDGGGNKRKRRRIDVEGDEDDSAESDEENDHTPSVTIDFGLKTDHLESAVDHDTKSLTESAITSIAIPQITSAVGSGLLRNSDGSIAVPRVVKRKRKPRLSRKASWNPALLACQNQEDDGGLSSADSFNSSDSEMDSASEEGQWSGIGSNDDISRAPSSDGGSNSVVEESEGSTSDPHSDDGSSTSSTRLPKKSGFKEWAQKQLLASKAAEDDFVSIPQTQIAELLPSHLRPQKPLPQKTKQGPLGEELNLPRTSFADHLKTNADDQRTQGPSKIKSHVQVDRSDDVRESRILLPIIREEQSIVETILLNPVVIICGETGSGKTTQVPQFLFEAGFGSPGSDNPGMIGITQPRRVAAMSMAARVQYELSLPSSRVSYQIRYDATVSPETSIKFMTDGVLLRELATDFLLSKYSVIIVDEAHERSMNTDILIGVLSRVMKLREDLWVKNKQAVKPLRLIIMSATLRVSDFATNKTLFPNPPPIINIDARQYPVTTHFNRRTVSDYVNEAVKKAIKIHSRLPPGGILIFLTGQNEIQGVCRKLTKKFGWKALEARRKRSQWSGDGHEVPKVEELSLEQEKINPKQGDIEAEELNIGDNGAEEVKDDLDEGATKQEDLEALDSESESESKSGDDDTYIDHDDSDVPMHIVPLYSLLPSEKQMKVFEPPPADSRLVVVATNVAETSLTIPGIKYVIDTGRAKQRQHDANSGIETFRISWISKASASQRAGRAGRTGPGHCYRLYSSAFFEHHFEQFDEPEILRMPIEGVVLQMKAMHIDAVVNFPFPTPPNRDSLKRAEGILTYLGALEHPSKTTMSVLPAKLLPMTGGQVTDLGRAMSFFPVSPRFSKMLVTGRQHGCLPYVIALVAGMSVGDPFVREEALETADHNTTESDDEVNSIDRTQRRHTGSEDTAWKEARKVQRSAFFKRQQQHAALGDHSSDIFRMLSVVGAFEYAGGGPSFCSEHFVRLKAMEEIHKLRSQISNIVQTHFADGDAGFTPKLPPPNQIQLKALRQLLTASFIDQVAVRKDLIEKTSANGTKLASCRGVAYRVFNTTEDVFIHPSSVLFGRSPPDWVVYTELARTSKIWIKYLTVINPAWLPKLGKSLCTFSKPLDLPASAKKLGSQTTIVKPKFGPQAWELPNMKI